MSLKNNLIREFKSYLNILRDNEGLTGEKALRNMTYLLILKLIEPHIGSQINLDNYDFDFESFFDDNVVDVYKARLKSVIKFSNLARENSDSIPLLLNFLWDIILSVHPSTKYIFLKGKNFDIQKSSTFEKLIEKINILNLSGVDYDVLGSAYEEVVKDIMVGKVLGQFFTQPLAKKIMIQLINPKIKNDGTFETCCDPTMGTGGFLISYLQEILKNAKEKNILPNWNFIKTKGLFGKEIESDTYQLAVSNMLISSGYFFENLQKGDSIREPIKEKYDNILANPPFGIKGFKYEDFYSDIKHLYVPIKTDNAVSLFLQACIYILKIDGKCAIVVPDGQDLHGGNSYLVAVRQYLLKTCDLKEIIYMPSGIFNYTSVKTCILFFIKKSEGSDVLIKEEKGKKITYRFSNNFQTKNVKFFNFDVVSEEKKLIVEVPIEKIKKDDFSLNANDYLGEEEELENEIISDEIVIKKLSDICEDITTSKSISMTDRKDGNFRFFSCSPDELTHDQHHFEGKHIIRGSRGTIKESVHFVNHEKYALGSNMIVSEVKSEEICLTKFLYYYLKLNTKDVEKIIKGTAIPMISKSDYYDIFITLPSIEKQEKAIEYFDFMFHEIKNLKKTINSLKTSTKKQFLFLESLPENEVVELKEICDFKNGKGLKKDLIVEGDYPVIGGGQSPMGYHNAFNMPKNTILCSSSGAYAGFINKYEKEVWASDCFAIIPKCEKILPNYLYYFLKANQEKIYKFQTGTAQPHVYSKNLENFRVFIPKKEMQENIVVLLQQNDKSIKVIEQLIKDLETTCEAMLLKLIHK
jgi:type I restriction-modification system DNA methylase subunit